jgi:hypothetical protein
MAISKKIVRYYEPLNADELAYLKKTSSKEKKSFFKAVHYAFLILSILLVFLYTIANFTYNPEKIDPEIETPLTPLFVVQIAICMYILLGLIFSAAYFLTLYKYTREIKKGMKVIEITSIKEKKYMPHNNKYYLYLHSYYKKSIEVEKQQFDQICINDEINIEYTPYSDIFLGYY